MELDIQKLAEEKLQQLCGDQREMSAKDMGDLLGTELIAIAGLTFATVVSMSDDNSVLGAIQHSREKMKAVIDSVANHTMLCVVTGDDNAH